MPPDLPLAALFDAAPGPCLVLDREFRVAHANRAWAHATGRALSDALGRPAAEVLAVDPDAAAAVLASLERVLATGEPDALPPIRVAADRHWRLEHAPVLGDDGAVAWIAQQAVDVTGQVRAETELRARTERQAFRAALEDRLRGLADAEEVVAAAAEALGRHMGAAQVGYGEIDASGEWLLIDREWNDGAVGSNARRHRLDDYGSDFIADLRRGRTVVVEDVRLDARTCAPEALDTFARAGVASFVTVPLVKEGRLVAVLGVHHGEPRRWPRHEVALAEQVAERTWTAAARARSEAELRRSEARLASALEVARLGTFDWDLVTGGVALDDRARALFGFGADEGRTADEVFARVHPDDLPRVRAEMADATAARARLENEYRLRLPDGTARVVYSVAEPVPGPDGALARMAGVFADETPRRAAQAAERELGERYRLAASATNDAIWDWDLASGRVQWNDAVHALFGHVLCGGESTGDWWMDHIHPDDRARVVDAIHAVIDGDGVRWTGEYRFLKHDGGHAHVLDRGFVLRDEAGRAVRMIGAMLDLTERREAEAALRAEEARYRSLFETMDEGFCVIEMVYDEGGRPCDYLFIEANPAFQKESGLPAPEGRLMRDMAPAHEQHWFDLYGEVARTRQPVRVEYEGAALGRWFDIHAFPTGDPGSNRVAVLFNDITQKRRAEIRLRELNATLEARVAETAADLDRVWRNAGDIFLVIDGDGVIRRMNPAGTSMLGWAEDEVVGRTIFDFIVPDDQTVTNEVLVRTRDAALPTFVNRYWTRDGATRAISWTASPEGPLIYAYGRDVTADKAREAELAAAQEALRQAQKMEAMGQLTGGVAHDFNNLLTPIVGSLDLLGRKGFGGERERRMIDGALQSAERAKTLVQRLLAFARRQPLQAEAVDVAALVEGMRDLVASTSGPRVRVEIDLAPALPSACADANQLEMALLNLAVNARDAMPDGGVLTVAARADEVGAQARAATAPADLKPGRYVRLSVADTGAGMDEATLARAVEPFFSTKGIGKGTGLGLSMVHGLAAQLGGGLHIASRPGVGTCIELWLPATTADVAQPSDRASDAAPRPGAGVALLVDDEEVVRMTTADMLGDLGYRVVEAGCADEALRLVEGGLDFDLLVTDHLMPGMTGAELARAVRHRRPDAPVLVVSGYAEVDGIAPDLPRLTKPFRQADLAASIAELDGAG